jgi:drug/metabolite transporter (DMT)-like permease
VVFIQSIPFAAIFGWLLFKEKFTFKKLFYVLAAFAGVILIAVSDYLSIFNFGKGELFSLISSALFTLSYVARRWQSDDLNDQELAQIFLFLGAIFMFVASIAISEKFPTVNWQLPILAAIFFTAFFNAVNIFLINYGFRRVKAVLAGNILTLEAIFALVLAFIFFRELPTLKELTGGLLIIASVIQMNKLELTGDL